MYPDLIFLFISACAGLLIWGMRSPGRIYQYPFLIGCIFTSFLVPQAISLYSNAGAVEVASIDKTFLMGALCMACAWLGYSMKPLRSVTGDKPHPLNMARLKSGGIALSIISLIATGSMGWIPQDQILSGTGPFTILAFFSAFSVVAFPILLIVALKQLNPGNIILASISAYPIVSAMLFSGRRSQTAEFIIFIAVAVYMTRKISVGRVAALAGVFAGAYLIPLMAAVRQDFWTSLFAGNLSELPFAEAMAQLQEGRVLELRNAAAIIEGTERTGIYGYGTGYWDAIVFRYVPGQLVGRDLKEFLQLKWGVDNWGSFQYIHGDGSTFTAIADTFLQFGYAGSLFFFLQGMIFRNLWVAADRGSLSSLIAYLGLIPFALVAVSHGSVWFVQGGLIVTLLTYAIYVHARPPKLRAGRSPHTEPAHYVRLGDRN